MLHLRAPSPPLSPLSFHHTYQIDRDTPGSSFCPISLSSSTDSTEEDNDGPDYIPPPDASPADKVPPAPRRAKKAKGPESYTRAEMKAFKAAAKAIRNVDPEKGHTLTTAQFLDAQFSDNTEKCVRARRSNNTWRKGQLDVAAAKAAEVIDARLVPS